MPIFRRRSETKPTPKCDKCGILRLAVRQLRIELGAQKAHVKELQERIRWFEETLPKVMGNEEKEYNDNPLSMQRAAARFAQLKAPEAEEEPEDGAIDIRALNARVEEVHLGGWRAPQEGEPTDIFGVRASGNSTE